MARVALTDDNGALYGAVKTSVDAAATATARTEAGVSATGYANSPAFIQKPTAAPAEVDKRPLTVRDRTTPSVDVARRRNLWRRTEDLGSTTHYTVGSGFTKGTEKITIDGVVLTKASVNSFYSHMYSNYTSAAPGTFIAGNRYLLSYYITTGGASERFFWMRNLPNVSRGHGQRLLQPGKLTRVWTIMHALTTSTLAPVQDPAVGFDSSAAGYWFYRGSQTGESESFDFYMGGFQIENIGTTAVDGIAAIGDSTLQGASGATDAPQARETLGYLAGLLNVNTYNRAVGGETTNTMDARWATDITPLKGVCKYVIIQGGINDIAQNRALADIQASITSMVNKATADGLIPVLLNCTPTSSIAADPVKEQKRLDLNAWLRVTFPNVIDIAQVIEDPFDRKYIRRTPGGADGWWGDGVHYTRAAKRAVAERIAAWPLWDFPTPTPYQKVLGDSWVAPGLVVASPNGTQYRLTVGDDGVVSTAAA